MDKYQSFTAWSEDCPVEWRYDDSYNILVDMETKKVMCVLTEPEDRTFGRDLKPIVELLNKAIATARAEALKDAAERADECLAYQGFKTGQYSLREFMRDAIIKEG